MQLIYNYNDYGYFVNATEARTDPKSAGRILVPRNATMVPAPQITADTMARFVNGEWQLINRPATNEYEQAAKTESGWKITADYRGVPFYLLPSRTPYYVHELNEYPPPGAVFELPELSDEEKRAILLPDLRRRIKVNTITVIKGFTYNTKEYKLTPEVISQLMELHSYMSVADDPAALFPAEIVMGENDDGSDDVQTINSPTAFATAYKEVMIHIRAKRQEAQALKASLDALTTAELETWIDPR